MERLSNCARHISATCATLANGIKIASLIKQHFNKVA